MSPKKPSKLLTEVELELMTILWRLGEGNVNDVLSALPAGRDLAYTSVSTILRILEQKGVVKARKEGRGHVYLPLLKKDDYEGATLSHVVSKVFEGEATSLVRRLIETEGLDHDDLKELRALLDERLKP